MLLLNFILSVIWMSLQESFTLIDFFVGFVVGFTIIALTQNVLREQLPARSQPLRPEAYPLQTWRAIKFIAFGLWSIIKANIDVARIIVRPRLNIKPGIIAIPLDVRSDVGITVLANLITLTPGTVTMDISSDKKTIYVHCIDIQDADAIRDDIKQNFESRVMELFP
jgi:multicomponent Na+:H+ antiporter subunit E